MLALGIIGAIVGLGGATWVAVRRRKVRAALRSEVRAATEIAASTSDAGPAHASVADDAGDLTVLMRRQA